MYVCMYLLYKAKESSFDYGCSGLKFLELSQFSIYVAIRAFITVNAKC